MWKGRRGGWKVVMWAYKVYPAFPGCTGSVSLSCCMLCTAKMDTRLYLGAGSWVCAEFSSPMPRLLWLLMDLGLKEKKLLKVLVGQFNADLQRGQGSFFNLKNFNASSKVNFIIKNTKQNPLETGWYLFFFFYHWQSGELKQNPVESTAHFF